MSRKEVVWILDFVALVMSIVMCSIATVDFHQGKINEGLVFATWGLLLRIGMK